MSYTTILGFNEPNKMTEIKELKNSHGIAPLVWGLMYKMFVKKDMEFNSYITSSDYDDLWPIYTDTDIDPQLRAVLIMTYDCAIINKKYYLKMADDIDFFLKFFSDYIPSDRINYLPFMAEFFRKENSFESIGFNQTSVIENQFLSYVYPDNEDEEENEDEDEDREESVFLGLSSTPHSNVYKLIKESAIED